MAEIPLGRGLVALVDDEDLGLVDGVKWRATFDRHTFYARRSIRVDGRKPSLLMHKVITGWSRTDHINGNGLDNRRINLREVTNTQNLRNARKARVASSRYKGIHWDASCGRWRARIGVNYKQINLGTFVDEIDAALAYDRAARERFGDFGAFNFPKPWERSGVA